MTQQMIENTEQGIANVSPDEVKMKFPGGWWVMAILLVFFSILGASLRVVPQVSKVGTVSPADTAWMLTATALVLLMTPGLSLFYGGMVRSKNVISTMLQSVICMGVVSLVWVIVGFSLAFGDSIHGLIGNPKTFFMFQGVGQDANALAPTIPLLLYALFQMKFAIITPALITGSFAERVRFSSYLLFVVLFSLLIYCPLAHWAWHPEGFLHQWGVLDFAGGTVVHMAAGFAALAGSIFLGPRNDFRRGQSHSPANVPFILLGTGMLWFGWFGFNAGSALAANGIAVIAFLNTNTASAAAMLAWIVVDRLRGRKVSATAACVGAVVGLVAITPAAGYVTVGSSFAIGVIAAIVCNIATHWRNQSDLDDTLDVFTCHGTGGMVGMLLTGVFATTAINASGSNGLLWGNPKLFFIHLGSLLLVTAFVFLGSLVLYRLVDWISPMRVSPEEEMLGLDLAQHGEAV